VQGKRTHGDDDGDGDGRLTLLEFVAMMRNAQWGELEGGSSFGGGHAITHESADQSAQLGQHDPEGSAAVEHSQQDAEAALMALAIMEHTDDHCQNEQLTANECHTFLKGSQYHGFYEWLMDKEDGARRSRFRDMDTDKHGALDITELHAAVRRYLELPELPRGDLLQPGALSKARAARAEKQSKGPHHRDATHRKGGKAKVKQPTKPSIMAQMQDKVMRAKQARHVDQRMMWDDNNKEWKPGMLLDGVQLASTKDHGVRDGPLVRHGQSDDPFYGLQQQKLPKPARDNAFFQTRG